MDIGDSAPDIFSRDRTDRNLIQRILKTGRTEKDPVSEAAAPAVTTADQRMPSARQQRRAERRARREGPTAAPRDSSAVADLEEGSEDLLGLEDAPAMAEPAVDISAMDAVTPDVDQEGLPTFDPTAKQEWQGRGNYFYSYKPASGNKPAEIVLHGGRLNRENPVRITETGQHADAFQAILAEARELTSSGQAGRYVTPQEYAKQRREEGVPSPTTDAQRAEQVGQEMFDFELAPANDTADMYTLPTLGSVLDAPPLTKYAPLQVTRRPPPEKSVPSKAYADVTRGEPIPMLDQAMNLMGFGEPTLRSLQSQATRALAQGDIEEAVRIGRQIQAQFPPNDRTAQNIGQSFIDQQRT